MNLCRGLTAGSVVTVRTKDNALVRLRESSPHCFPLNCRWSKTYRVENYLITGSYNIFQLCLVENMGQAENP